MVYAHSQKKRGGGPCLAQVTSVYLFLHSLCNYFIISILPTEIEHRERLKSRPNARVLKVFSHGWASHQSCKNRLKKKLSVVAICETKLEY